MTSQRPLSLTFQLAVDQYSAEHGAAEVECFKTCSLQDALNSVICVGQAREDGRAESRVRSLIAFVQRYQSAIDCLAQTASGGAINPAVLIWGLIRILLQTASSSAEYFQRLIDLLHDLGDAVNLYTAYEDIYVNQSRFRDALGVVYLDIIAVLAKARKMFKQSRSRLLLRSFIKTFETDFRNDLIVIKRHLKQLDQETTMAHRTQVRNYVASHELRASHLHKGNRLLTDRIIQWLAPQDAATCLAEITSIRQPGSGVWLLHNSTYTEWRETGVNRVLWITGQPGVGKTVLSSVIVEGLEEMCSAGHGAVAYFHGDAGCDTGRSTIRLLATLISQTAAHMKQDHIQDNEWPTCVTRAYEKARRLGRTSLSQADNPGVILLDLATEFKDSMFVVVDGLDELDDSRAVAETMLKLSSQIPSLQVVFLSRDIQAIRKALACASKIHIAPSDVQQDVDAYIQRRSSTLPLENEEARNEVVREISSKSQGMFLWTRMVLNDVSSATTMAELRDMLRSCPSGLHAVYGHFLKCLAEQGPRRRRLASDVLKWVCCASRPLTLDELVTALSTTVSQDQVQEEERPFRSVVAEICSPFLVLHPISDLVRPVHESIREYLLDEANRSALDPEKASYIIEPPEAHAEIALRCMKYLESSSSESMDGELNTFGQYAKVAWCYHAVRGSHRKDLEDQVLSTISTPEERQNWLFWALFKNEENFPFQKMFQLQGRLSEWAQASKCTQLQNLLLGDWSMDALELLLKLDSLVSSSPGQLRGYTKIRITYFNKMMVLRGLARQLNRTNQLPIAVKRMLEETGEWKGLGQGSKASMVQGRLAFRLNILGILYDQQGLAELALRTHHDSLGLQENVLGVEHPETIWTVNELGRMYRHLGKTVASEAMHRRALSVLEKSLLDKEHPERIWTINTLATTLRMHGRTQEALELHVAAYDARCKDLGELHGHTLWSCGDVAKCYHDLGLHDKALQWFRKASAGRIKILGPGHPDTLWSANQLGLLLADMGALPEALALQSNTLAAQERVHGTDHKHTIWTRSVVRELRESVPTSYTGSNVD